MSRWLRRDPWHTEAGLRAAATIAATELFTSFVDETSTMARAARVLAGLAEEDQASFIDFVKRWQVAPQAVTLWMSTESVARDLPTSLRSRFESKWRLYREAACLMPLLRREEQNPRYFVFVVEYERLILPATKTAEGEAKTSALRDAMKDLVGLVNGAPRTEIRWALTWFERELGVEIPALNPATAMAFGLCCLRLLTAIETTFKNLAVRTVIPT